MEKNVLQLFTINHDLKIIQIITWDFDRNMEKSMMQIIQDPKSDIGYHVVKGMNLKMNYLV